ncbi:hypothetical protein BCF53_10517 [Reinekea marinisedimentorum]|uniref:Uncharacterized protein n=1 Tax=Reinekea marinisedimentorum TaxID=230495 RepID=A0A4R3I8E8_9GAMM|nr:hypothetical protein [Reinekea marinisedimentorum]TCS41592.1 hypothetical protein BCF53_10517 [Reinekea marinisedimentorum]
MAEVRSLNAFKKAQQKKQAAGHTLCRSGRHKWQIDKETVFDSKQGKLVNRYRCTRCGKIKTSAQ